jgi:hypothetical protein
MFNRFDRAFPATSGFWLGTNLDPRKFFGRIGDVARVDCDAAGSVCGMQRQTGCWKHDPKKRKSLFLATNVSTFAAEIMLKQRDREYGCDETNRFMFEGREIISAMRGCEFNRSPTGWRDEGCYPRRSRRMR